MVSALVNWVCAREVEFEALSACEDLVEAALSPRCRYAFVGRIASKDARERVFYVEKRDVVVDLMNKLQGGDRHVPSHFIVNTMKSGTQFL